MTSRIRVPQLFDAQQAADHLCLLVSPRSYREHTLLVVTADADGRPVHHIEVVNRSPGPSTSECATVLGNLLTALACDPSGSLPHGLLLAVTRPGGEAVQAGDQIWFRAFHRVCHARGIAPLGVYIVGRHGARPIQIDDAA
jgi:hypothetical protein